MSLKNKFASLLLIAAMSATAWAAPAPVDKNGHSKADQIQVNEPLDIAILIQDDVVARVGNELGVTREFIRSLPDGSRVMIGYVRAGTLQVRQSFTEDLDQAAKALRVPTGSSSSAPYNPYVEVVEALKKFDSSDRMKAVLLVSDGLDTSRGFDVSSTTDSIDLQRAIREAKKRGVAVYSFYAPTVTEGSRNHFAIGFGQSALNRLSNETGGKAFFQGSSFVTFDSYFTGLRRELNEQAAGA
ncbi:MAG: hypothetical protein ABIP75_06705 [Pyrinomonadaceae bacterium]